MITVAMFAIILLVILGITAWAARHTRTTSDFYAAGKGLTAAQNGFALAGDWCSAAYRALRNGRRALRRRSAGGLLHRAASDRRAAAQYRHLHNRRCDHVSDAPAAGARRGHRRLYRHQSGLPDPPNGGGPAF